MKMQGGSKFGVTQRASVLSMQRPPDGDIRANQYPNVTYPQVIYNQEI